MLIRFALAAAIAAIPTIAFSQATVLQGGTWTKGQIPVYGNTGGSQPIITSGGTAAGGAVGVNPSQLGITASGTGTAPYVSQGGGPNGEIVCLYDAPTTNATGYHSLCLSPNVTGNTGLISYQAGGAASPQPLRFLINGTGVTFNLADCDQQGGIPYVNSSGALVCLPPGISGQVLKTNGPNADPSWVSAPGSGTVTQIDTGTGLTGGPITASGTISVGLVPVANGGTGLTSGTSGGIPAFTGSTTITSSGVLAQNQIMLGGGAGGVPATLGSLGTSTTVLHGNASGPPTFGPVSLTADVSGTLPVANGGTGITAFGTGVGAALGQNVTGSGGMVLQDSPTITNSIQNGNAQGSLYGVGQWQVRPNWALHKSNGGLDPYGILNMVAVDYINDVDGKPSFSTFTRASNATYFDAIGIMQTASSGELRHDFDPDSGEYLGWLIEEQRTNLLLGSADLGNASYWTADGVTVAANAAVAPDGNTAADRLTYSSGNNRNSQSVSISAAAANYTLSAYVKADTATYTRLDINTTGGADPTTGTSVVINLGAGTVAVLSGAGSAAIRAIGDGWYRVSVTHTSAASHNLLAAYAYGSTDAAGAAAAGSSYWWGLQSEAGDFSTSYIATAGSQVTRAADQLTVPVSAFAFNATEGTLLVEARFNSGASTPTAASLGSGGSNNYTFTGRVGGAFRNRVVSGGTNSFLSDGGTATGGQSHRIALAYRADDFAGCFNGGAVATDASGAVPTGITTLVLGGVDFASSANLNGHLSHLAYFPRRLANADLQNITR